MSKKPWKNLVDESDESDDAAIERFNAFLNSPAGKPPGLSAEDMAKPQLSPIELQAQQIAKDACSDILRPKVQSAAKLVKRALRETEAMPVEGETLYVIPGSEFDPTDFITPQ